MLCERRGYRTSKQRRLLALIARGLVDPWPFHFVTGPLSNGYFGPLLPQQNLTKASADAGQPTDHFNGELTTVTRRVSRLRQQRHVAVRGTPQRPDLPGKSPASRVYRRCPYFASSVGRGGLPT